MNPAPDAVAIRPPARWLAAAFVVLLCLAGVLANRWAVQQRNAAAPSLVSPQPGFAVEALADPSGTLTFEDVLAGAGSPAGSAAPDKEGGRRTWYRLTVSNDGDSVRHAILGISDDYVSEAVLCQSGPGGRRIVQRTGGTVLWSRRSVPARKPAFAITLPPRARSVLCIRMDGSSGQPTRFMLWNDAGSFGRLSELVRLQFVGYFSLWIGLAAYNGFLYAVLRRRDYLLYLLYVLNMGALVFAAGDLTTLLVPWPHWPLRDIVVTVLLNLATFNLVGFSRVFLETSVRMPSFDRFLRRLGWTLLAASLAAPAWLWPAAATAYRTADTGLNIIALAAMPVLGFTLFLRRGPQAGLYVLAFVPLVGALIHLLADNVGTPDARANGMPILCADALQLALLALALAWRYRRIADEADRFRLEYTARLEEDVARRTRELRESNESLARINRDKDRVFGIIGHDLRGPAQSLFGLARLFSSDPGLLPPQELASLAKKIEESCESQLVLLDNLLLWGRTHLGGLKARPGAQAAADIIHAAVAALAPAALGKGILLGAEPGSGLSVQADPQAAQAVLRNLLDNALKFTPSGGRVTVAAARKGAWIEFSVRDTGTGMSRKRLAELFTGPVDSRAGTRSEKGAGVGLTLCRDLARANGGDLRIESEPGQGTLATLVLPSWPSGT